jgi:hypothetical protein
MSQALAVNAVRREESHGELTAAAATCRAKKVIHGRRKRERLGLGRGFENEAYHSVCPYPKRTAKVGFGLGTEGKI